MQQLSCGKAIWIIRVLNLTKLNTNCNDTDVALPSVTHTVGPLLWKGKCYSLGCVEGKRGHILASALRLFEKHGPSLEVALRSKL